MVLSYIVAVCCLWFIERVKPGVIRVLREESERFAMHRPRTVTVVIGSGAGSFVRAVFRILLVTACNVVWEEVFVACLSFVLYFYVFHSFVGFVVACVVHGLLHLVNVVRGVRFYPLLQLCVACLLSLYVLFTHDLLLLLVLHAVDHLLTNSLSDILRLVRMVRGS